MSTSNLKLGTHRGSPRLWLEGSKLSAAGFKRGDKFEIREAVDTAGNPRGLVIIKTPEGDRTATSRTRNGKEKPIIDAHSKEWLKLFPSGRIYVEYHPTGRIMIADAVHAAQVGQTAAGMVA